MRRPRRSRTFRVKLKDDPDNFIAQPTLALSTCPTYFETGVAPRHVDLRPFRALRIGPACASCRADLTRVALKEGIAGRQFEPGRRHQGHLDRRRHADGSGPGLASDLPMAHPVDGSGASVRAKGFGPTQTQSQRKDNQQPCWHVPPTASSGFRATWSAPISSRASSRRRSGSRVCRPSTIPSSGQGTEWD